MEAQGSSLLVAVGEEARHNGLLETFFCVIDRYGATVLPLSIALVSSLSR